MLNSTILFTTTSFMDVDREQSWRSDVLRQYENFHAIVNN